MFSLPKNPIVRALVLCLVVMLLFVPSVAQVQAGSNPLLSIFVGFMFGLVGLVIYDAVSCQLNILFGGCGGGGGSGGSGANSSGANGNSAGDTTGGTGTGGAGGAGGGSNLVACTTGDITNACGLSGTGFVVNGVCNATPPPNSSCPAPIIGSAGFYADPSRVREGETTTLHWDVTNATVCTLTGGGLSLLNLGIVGEAPTQEINQKTEYDLSCQNGIDGGPITTQTATVSLIPSYKEI